MFFDYTANTLWVGTTSSGKQQIPLSTVNGVTFPDATVQTTAAVTASGGSSIIANNAGISITDPFGGGLQTTSTFAFLGADNSGGGFSQFYNGTVWTTVAADGNGNGLFLGTGIDGSNFNLSNEATSSGIVNPSGAITNIYGTPVNIVGTLVFGGVAMPSVAPTIGQVMTATSATAASWQTPSGGQVTKTASVAVGVIASATPSTIISYTWPTPFADNNYSVVGSVEVAETPSDGAATAICTIGMIQKMPGGVGINFVVCNADGVSHNVTANFIAIHN
jgi:hypothetical protein